MDRTTRPWGLVKNIISLFVVLVLLGTACGDSSSTDSGEDTTEPSDSEDDTDEMSDSEDDTDEMSDTEDDTDEMSDTEDDTDEMSDSEDDTDEMSDTGNRGDIGTIKLAVNPWNGSAANVAVAKALLENELDYSVEITELDENAQWAAINTGDLHASLEVWPSGHAQNVADFIDGDNDVVNAGLLGPIGKIGWYVPTYMVEKNPTLATWEGFKDPALAGLFATAETGDLGQFLGGDPSFVQHDHAIIENLELSLEVVYAGSEEAILASVDAAISREDPVLVYLWTPHSAHNAYDLTEIQLPDYTDECYETADSDGVDCDYPADELFKIAWAGLEDGAPDAFTLLTNMQYTTADQVAILASIETDGLSVDDAAALWIENNEATWKAWLP